MSRIVELAALFTAGVITGGAIIYSSRKPPPTPPPSAISQTNVPSQQQDVVFGQPMTEGISPIEIG